MHSNESSTWVDDLAEGPHRAPRAQERGVQAVVTKHLPEERAGEVPPDDLEDWLLEMFPQDFDSDFGYHHRRFIQWAGKVDPGDHPQPYIAIWPRGGGKSTLVECVVIALGAPRPVYQEKDDGDEMMTLESARNYCLYVSETQEQADRHVEDIGTRLESPRLASRYPQFASPKIRETGQRKSWSRTRLITGTGFVIDALGLNSAGRGVKVEDVRPDCLVFDDIDDKHDTQEATRKKETTIKDTIIPMFGGDGAAIIGIQNKIIPDGVFARLSDDRADYLLRRRVDGPHKAISGLETEKRYREDLGEDGRYIDTITEGEPLWDGQDLEQCQRRIEESGLDSFLRECQHEVEDVEGALWTRDQLSAVRVSDHPSLRRIIVAVDPSGGNAETGIIVIGLGVDGKAYVLQDRSMPGHTPNAWGREIVDAYDEWKADAVIAEGTHGGEMVRGTIVSAIDDTRNVPVYLVDAKRGKYTRAEPVASAYGDEDIDWQDTKVHHVGSFPDLEHQMRTYVPGNESPDRLDALVWGLKKLVITKGVKESGSQAPGTQTY